MARAVVLRTSTHVEPSAWYTLVIVIEINIDISNMEAQPNVHWMLSERLNIFSHRKPSFKVHKTHANSLLGKNKNFR
jgi:hypothetical protein